MRKLTGRTGQQVTMAVLSSATLAAIMVGGGLPDDRPAPKSAECQAVAALPQGASLMAVSASRTSCARYLAEFAYANGR